jgi:hypothetical protein
VQMHHSLSLYRVLALHSLRLGRRSEANLLAAVLHGGLRSYDAKKMDV